MASQQQQHLLDDVDGILREYLTWRGFGHTLQALARDIKEDFYSGLSSKRLVERLFREIDQMSIDAVFAWWDEGVAPLLVRVEDDVAQIGRTFRDSTFRLLLVTFHKHNRQDLVLQFFSRHWQHRVGTTRFRDEWKKQWFSLPYLAAGQPERDRYFAVYFSADWRSNLFASLESFVNAVLVALPVPRLIALGTVRDVVDGMRVEIDTLKMMSSLSLALPVATTMEVEVEEEEEQEEEKRAAAASSPTKTTPLPPLPPFTPLGKRQGALCSVRFSPSCELVAGCGRDATCVIWPASPSSSSSSSSSSPPAPTPRLFCNSTASCLDWFDDGLVCVGTLDHTLNLWRPGNSNQISCLRTPATLPHVLDCSVSAHVVACSVAPANAALPGGEVQLWNAQAEKMDRVLDSGGGGGASSSRVPRLQFNHNGALLVTGALDGMVRVFDVVAGGGAIMGWPTSAAAGGVQAVALSRHETSVFCLMGGEGDAAAVVEYSLHKAGEVVNRFALPSPSAPQQQQRSPPLAREIRVSASRLAVVRNGTCTVINNNTASGGAGGELVLDNVSCADWDESTLVCGGLDGGVRKYAL